MAERRISTTRAEQPNKGGRPTRLSDELLEKAAGCVDQCFDEVPTKGGFAIYLNVHRSTAYQWAERESKLGKRSGDICEGVMAGLAKRIIDGVLDGRFTTTFSALMMSKHGYVKEVHQDHTTNGKELPVPILGGATQDEMSQTRAHRVERTHRREGRPLLVGLDPVPHDPARRLIVHSSSTSPGLPWTAPR